jgi:undecaprenyl-diphosphatase
MSCCRVGVAVAKGDGQDLTVLEALILGVVQGVTEFLPVSSSAHLVLVPEFFGIPAPTVAFDVLLHLATLIAVVGYFFADVKKMVISVIAPRRMERQEVKHWRRFLAWLVIGSIPAAIIGGALSGFFEDLFASTTAVGIFLLVTSALLWGADLVTARAARIGREPAPAGKMAPLDALLVGCYQALAIAPGISRSGSTIAAGVFLGFDRQTAARFAFLLSIPAILGAFLFSLGDIATGMAGTGGIAYVIGFVAAGISGFLAVRFMMRYLKEHRLRPFAIYTLALGLFVIVVSVA